MTRKSIVELLAQADATLPDNSTQEISAADVRLMIKDFLDTIAPSYGAVQCASSVETLAGTPVTVAPFTAIIAQTSALEWNLNLSTGEITRLLNGVAGNTTRITIDGAIEGPNNSVVDVLLYKNGAPSQYEVSVTTRGAGRPVSCNFSGIVYNDTDTVFTIVLSGDAGTYTVSDLLVLCENVPVNSFV